MLRTLILVLVSLLPFSARALSLDEAVRLATTRSHEARIAEAKARGAAAGAGLARSGLLPQVNLSGQALHHDSEISIPNFADPEAPGLVIQPQDSWAGSIGASQVLFAPALFGKVAATSAGERIAAAQAEAGAQDAGLVAAQLWLGARAAGELRRAAEESLQHAREHLAVARKALASGTSTQLAVDRAALSVSGAEAKVLAAEKAEADALGRLAIAVGSEEPVEVGALDAGAGATGDEGALIDRALAGRPEMQAARAGVDAAKAGRWSVVAAWAPTVSAVAAWQYTNATAFAGDNDSWYVGLQANLPIFDGGARFYEAGRVGADIDGAEETLARVDAATREAVRAALRSERVAARQLELARERAATAEHARQIAEASFRAGAGTSLDVQDAQDAWLDAEASRIAAEGALELSHWQLRRVVGG